MNTTNYWHFRGGTAVIDEDSPGDSVMIPVDSITGILPGHSANDVTSIGNVTIFYEKPSTYSHFTNNSDVPSQNGQISLEITDGKQKEVLEFLAHASNTRNNKKSYTTIADDLNGEYAFRYIINCALLRAA